MDPCRSMIGRAGFAIAASGRGFWHRAMPVRPANSTCGGCPRARRILAIKPWLIPRSLTALVLWCLPAAAQVGSGCTTNAINGVNNLTSNIETLLYCSTSSWIADVQQIGSTSATCSGTTAGTLQYTSSTFEGCNGPTWITLGGGGGTVTLGTSASVTNPQRSGDATTGLFSPATGAVAVSSSGT